jgi:hypothetical protein
MSNEYKTHSFKKEWHDQVLKFIDENEDLAFDSPKYFIKFCVNKYIDEQSSPSKEEVLEKARELGKEIGNIEDKK